MPLTGESCIELIEQKGEYLFQEDRKKLIEDALGEFVLSEKILITDREFLGDEDEIGNKQKSWHSPAFLFISCLTSRNLLS